MIRAYAAAALALVFTACSGSPTTPTPPPVATPPPPATLNLTGTNWVGNVTMLLDGAPLELRIITATFTHSNRTLTGTFTLTRDFSGRLSGELSADVAPANFSGSITLETPSDQPPIRCTGTTTATGSSSSATSLQINGPLLTQGNCEGEIRNLTMTLSR